MRARRQEANPATSPPARFDVDRLCPRGARRPLHATDQTGTGSITSSPIYSSINPCGVPRADDATLVHGEHAAHSCAASPPCSGSSGARYSRTVQRSASATRRDGASWIETCRRFVEDHELWIGDQARASVRRRRMPPDMCGCANRASRRAGRTRELLRSLQTSPLLESGGVRRQGSPVTVGSGSRLFS